MNWISVKDRFPEEDQRVIACGKDFTQSAVYTRCFKGDPLEFIEDSCCGLPIEDEVTHWIPLPRRPDVI